MSRAIVRNFAQFTSDLLKFMQRSDKRIIKLPRSEGNFDIEHFKKEFLEQDNRLISVAGDSQPYDEHGSKAWLNYLDNIIKSNPNHCILFGLTGRPFGNVVDVNGGVSQLLCELDDRKEHIPPVIAQIVDQTPMAIEKWGCQTLPPELISLLIWVTGEKDRPTVFGDDAFLEGQLNHKFLESLFAHHLIDAASEKGNIYFDSNIREILKKIDILTLRESEKEEQLLTDIELQILMDFCVYNEIDLSKHVGDISEVLSNGISDAILLGSGGAQSLWQGTVNLAHDKSLRGISSLRGPDNPKTTIIVDDGQSEFRDFFDAAEFFGYLANAKETNGNCDFFDLINKYSNGNINNVKGLNLSGIRLPYNPGNSDVAREDEAKGGLNSKMRMTVQTAFIMGCLGLYKELDPSKIKVDVLTRESEGQVNITDYAYAAKHGFAPTPENPTAGKYHNNRSRIVPDSELNPHNASNLTNIQQRGGEHSR